MLSRRSVVFATVAVSLLMLIGCKGFFTPREDSGGGGGGGGGGTGVTPKFAYVANGQGTADSTISGYTVNASTGGLTSTGQPTDLTMVFDAKSLAADPSGNRLFVLLGSGGVMPFTIDRNTGALSDPSNTGAPQPITNIEPSLAVVSLDGKYLLTLSVPTNELDVFPVQSLGRLGDYISYSLPSGGVPVGITLDSNGRLLYVADDTKGTAVYTFNTTTGVLTSTATVAPNGPAAKGVAITPDGKFAFISNGATTGGVDMYAVNGNNGTLTLMNSSPVATGGTNPGALVVDPLGKYLYVANNGSGNVSEFSIGSDGSLTPISGSPVSAGNNPVSIAVDPSAKFVYVANKDDGTVSIYKIGSNGALTSGGYVSTANPNSVVVTK